jgi:ribonuclease BN (tRNA processing enzyme)
MKVRILGAHNIESATTGCFSILIDGVIAVDAGALTKSLMLEEQKRLKALLLTHRHYDHLRDIPALGMSLNLQKKNLTIYAPAELRGILTTHLIDNVLYPNYLERPAEKPVFRFQPVEPMKALEIAGYKVMAVPVKHSVPTVGYRITAADGKQVFITSDTGPGLAECWQQVNPQLLIIELTMADRNEAEARQHGHLTPTLLKKELEAFKVMKGYLPQVAVVHINPLDEEEIKAEMKAAEKGLGIEIKFGYEGMTVEV